MTLQSILGKNYKWWYLFTNGYKANNAYLLNDVLYFLGLLIGNTAIFIIYKFITTQSILEELIFLNFFSIFLGCNIIKNLSFAVQSGGLTSYLLQPTNIMFRFFVFRLGVRLKSFVLD